MALTTCPNKKLYAWVGDTSHLDVSNIRGNVDTEVKQICAGILEFFVNTPEGKVYGAQVGKRLKFAEINVWGEGAACNAQTVLKITVEKDMCNTFGVLHGACAAYMIDPCSVSPLVVLGLKLGIDGTGFSQSMNIIWHHPIKRGVEIRLVSNSMSMRGRIRTVRCEIWAGETMCVTAVHSTVNVPSQSHVEGKL